MKEKEFCLILALAVVLGVVAICILIMSFVLPERTGEEIYRYAGGILLLFGVIEVLVFSVLWKRDRTGMGYRACTLKTYTVTGDDPTPTTSV